MYLDYIGAQQNNGILEPEGICWCASCIGGCGNSCEGCVSCEGGCFGIPNSILV